MEGFTCVTALEDEVRFSFAEYATRKFAPMIAGDQYCTLLPWRRSNEALVAPAKVRPSALVTGAPMVTGPTPKPGVPINAPVYVMPVKYIGSTAPLRVLYGVSHWPTNAVPHAPLLKPRPVLREAMLLPPASTATPDSIWKNAATSALIFSEPRKPRFDEFCVTRL